jgi:hypothetical protein
MFLLNFFVTFCFEQKVNFLNEKFDHFNFFVIDIFELNNFFYLTKRLNFNYYFFNNYLFVYKQIIGYQDFKKSEKFFFVNNYAYLKP